MVVKITKNMLPKTGESSPTNDWGGGRSLVSVISFKYTLIVKLFGTLLYAIGKVFPEWTDVKALEFMNRNHIKKDFCLSSAPWQSLAQLDTQDHIDLARELNVIFCTLSTSFWAS